MFEIGDGYRKDGRLLFNRTAIKISASVGFASTESARHDWDFTAASAMTARYAYAPVARANIKHYFRRRNEWESKDVIEGERTPVTDNSLVPQFGYQESHR